MVKFSAALAVATLAASASAFAPNHVSPKFGVDMAKQSTSALSMAEENNSKRKIAFKAMKRVAGGLATVALATSGASPAFAAKKAVEIVEVVEAVDSTKKILTAGASAVVAGVAAVSLLGGGEKKQDFLEASPYYDQSTVPVNVYKNKAPFTGKVVSTKRIVGPKATGETCHIVINHNGDFPYWEGQSWGVIPPGVREKDGKPHSVRLYSIASSRYGDDMTGKTGSLCVRRATYWCPELKADDPAKKGICSNFLCDTKAGEEVQMTGPAGKVMLMPEEDPTTDYIMVATGTGIAPYRGFIRRLFVEKTPAAEVYKGEAWLFLGVANSDALLYDDEFQEAKSKYPDNFRLDYALSREQENSKGGKMYIQDKVEEYADEVFGKLESGAHIYFCGLKGMMPGIQEMLKGVAEKKGLDYDEWLKGLKKKKQWHVEVY
jgi:ferredoxin--NADP+ reductase